jgi:hypothetical protein
LPTGAKRDATIAPHEFPRKPWRECDDRSRASFALSRYPKLDVAGWMRHSALGPLQRAERGRDAH